VISIKKHLDSDDARLRVIFTLLEGISEHSLAADPVAHKNFQSSLQSMLEELSPTINPTELLLMAGRAVQAFEDYNSAAAASVAQQSTELNAIVDMLTKTIGAISVAHGRSAAHLTAMQEDLKKAAYLDDVRVLRIRIAHCLGEIEAEVRAQERETGATLESLRQQVHGSQPASLERPAPGTDLLTGLPDRITAELAITNACHSPVRTYAALYVLENIVVINRRFGVEIGDRALREFNRLLREHAGAADRFYRWSGPSFLALLERLEPIEKVSAAAVGAISRNCEITVDTEARTLMLPLYCRSAVFPIPAAPQAIISQLDAFAVGHKR
jgi:GGDEF domain-containing protein